MKPLGPLLLSIVALAISGCSSFTASNEPGRGPLAYQRYFVKSNFNDNHGLDGRIMRALQDRGFEVNKGPLTMMPNNAQAIVTYEDRWGWDFKTHLTGLTIVVREAKNERPVAYGTFVNPASLMRSPDAIIEKLLDKVLSAPPAPALREGEPPPGMQPKPGPMEGDGR